MKLRKENYCSGILKNEGGKIRYTIFTRLNRTSSNMYVRERESVHVDTYALGKNSVRHVRCSGQRHVAECMAGHTQSVAVKADATVACIPWKEMAGAKVELFGETQKCLFSLTSSEKKGSETPVGNRRMWQTNSNKGCHGTNSGGCPTRVTTLGWRFSH